MRWKGKADTASSVLTGARGGAWHGLEQLASCASMRELGMMQAEGQWRTSGLFLSFCASALAATQVYSEKGWGERRQAALFCVTEPAMSQVTSLVNPKQSLSASMQESIQQRLD